jgi:uncharacterized membrane protein YvbJ
MYCQNCGKQLPNDAKFCLNCGKPQNHENRVAPSKNNYEYCTLNRKSNILEQWWEALKGKQIIGSSSRKSGNLIQVFNPLGGNLNNIDREINLELVSKLSSQGWEIVTQDDNGCVVSMRRLIS